MDSREPLLGLHDAPSEGLNAFLSRKPNDFSAVRAWASVSFSRVVRRSGLRVGDRACAGIGMLDRDRARLAFVGDRKDLCCERAEPSSRWRGCCDSADASTGTDVVEPVLRRLAGEDSIGADVHLKDVLIDRNAARTEERCSPLLMGSG